LDDRTHLFQGSLVEVVVGHGQRQGEVILAAGQCLALAAGAEGPEFHGAAFVANRDSHRDALPIPACRGGQWLSYTSRGGRLSSSLAPEALVSTQVTV